MALTNIDSKSINELIELRDKIESQQKELLEMFKIVDEKIEEHKMDELDNIFPTELYMDKECTNAIYRDALGNPKGLKSNQRMYGYDRYSGAWDLKVTYKNGKYITNHYMEHLNNKELYRKLR